MITFTGGSVRNSDRCASALKSDPDAGFYCDATIVRGNMQEGIGIDIYLPVFRTDCTSPRALPCRRRAKGIIEWV